MICDDEEFSKESLKPITDDIKEKIETIEKAKSELAKNRNKKRCKVCGEMIDNNSVFCKSCGQKVV